MYSFSRQTFLGSVSSIVLSASLLALTACGGGGGGGGGGQTVNPSEVTSFAFKSAFINSLSADVEFSTDVDYDDSGKKGVARLKFILPKATSKTFEAQSALSHTRKFSFTNASFTLPDATLLFASSTYQIIGLESGDFYCVATKSISLPESVAVNQTLEIANLNCFFNASKEGESFATKIRLTALSVTSTEGVFKIALSDEKDSSDVYDLYVEQFALKADGRVLLQSGDVQLTEDRKVSYRVK